MCCFLILGRVAPSILLLPASLTHKENTLTPDQSSKSPLLPHPSSASHLGLLPSFALLIRVAWYLKKIIMIKRLPSRNQRSKGVKIKHVLQIILLLGVCFWLIYQIKHSHDKKKEFDENDAKVSGRMQTADQIPKLGRKDLHPGKDDVIQNEKHEEEEEDENIVDDEGNKHEHDESEEEGSKHETEEKQDKHGVREQGEEEENKHGVEEQEEDENKSEEMEDEGRGGGDDEIDENDQEKSEVETDREEEFMDEEKDKEENGEKDNENTEDEEKEGLVENQNTREAREEHYKGDDASSAVAHDTQTTSTETEIVSMENSNANSEMSIIKQENEPNHIEESNRNQNDSGKITDDDLKGGNSLNTTAGKESGETILSNPLDGSNVNNTTPANSDGHLEASSNHTVVITEASNNSTVDGVITLGSSEQNKMVKLAESEHAQNTTGDKTATGDVKNGNTEELEQSNNRIREDNLPNFNSSVSVKTGNGDVAAGESSNSGAGELEKTIRYVASNETQNDSRNSDTEESVKASVDEKSKGNTETGETNGTQNSSDAKDNNDATKDEKSKGDTQTGETDETSDSSSVNSTTDGVEHDAIDSSDAHIHKDVTEVRTDLETLPDIRTEGNIDDETTAE